MRSKSSPRAVIIIIGMLDILRISRQTSKPSFLGIINCTKIILLWQIPNVLPKGSCYGDAGALCTTKYLVFVLALMLVFPINHANTMAATNETPASIVARRLLHQIV